MASWKKVVVSGSDANLKSLVVSQSVNAESFTGSLQGSALSAEVVVINSSTAPTSSLSGSLWYNTDNLTLYVRYTDPSGSTYWVPSYNAGIPVTSSYSISSSLSENAQTASFVNTSETASYVQTAQTASFVNTARTASYVVNSLTASYVANSLTASILAGTASQAFTASFVNTARTASYVATAQTASYWSGSILSSSYASSSTIAQAASKIVTREEINNYDGKIVFVYGNYTSSTAQFPYTSDYITFNPNTRLLAATASIALTASTALTASRITGSDVVGIVAQSYTASYVATAQTASYVVTALTASFVDTARTASFVTLAQTASYVNTLSQNVTVTGSLTVSGTLSMSNRPAFRVTGAGGAKSAVSLLSGSYLNVDYQQGGGWNNSTGTFTAPIAGLYMVTLVVRTNSNSLGTISQLVVYKNNTGGTTGTAQIMVEFGANTTMNHTGGSTICKLDVGDTLRMVVPVGEISFDLNDNFSVAYLG